MPSRYSAYVFQLTDYLLKTWHPSTRPEPFHFDQKMKHKWLGLEIKNCTTLDPHTATVEFIAHYKVNDVKHYLHEISRFSREDGFWYYVTGIFPE